MNYQKIKKLDIANGEGIRVVLFVSGCNHHCEGCFQPETWNKDSGKTFTNETMREIFNELKNPHIHGLTLSGGDPLFPSNRETITQLCYMVKKCFPGKTIWCWTGYLYEEVKDLPVMKLIDILVDGPFKIEEKDLTLKWCGSRNQRVINVQKSLKEGKVILYE